MNTNKPPLLVIPALNAAETLHELVDRISRVHPERDVLVVNDGSTDNTEKFLSERRAQRITFAKNRGKGAALLAGFRRAQESGHGEVVSIDADLQHAPEDINNLREERRRHPEAVIIGNRMSNPLAMPLGRRFSNNLTSLIVSIFSGKRIRDTQSGFRLIPLHLLRAICARSQGFALEAEIAFKLGLQGANFRDVPINVIYRGAQSHIHPLFDTVRFMVLVWRRLWL